MTLEQLIQSDDWQQETDTMAPDTTSNLTPEQAKGQFILTVEQMVRDLQRGSVFAVAAFCMTQGIDVSKTDPHLGGGVMLALSRAPIECQAGAIVQAVERAFFPAWTFECRVVENEKKGTWWVVVDTIKRVEPVGLPVEVKKSVIVDFDGVLHRYSDGWKDGTIYDPPVEGAKEAMAELQHLGFRVVIHSCRCRLDKQDCEAQRRAMKAWLLKHKIPYDELHAGGGKPWGVLYIDDNAYRYDPTVEWSRQMRDSIRPLLFKHFPPVDSPNGG